MQKPSSLRAALAAVISGLQENPDRLAMYVDEAKVKSIAAPDPHFPSPAFRYEYRLNVELIEYTGHPDVVMVATILWLTEHQPELLAGGDTFELEADILSEGVMNLGLALRLTETVTAARTAGGGYDLTHAPEPPLVDEFPGVPRWTSLRQVTLAGVPIVGDVDDG